MFKSSQVYKETPHTKSNYSVLPTLIYLSTFGDQRVAKLFHSTAGLAIPIHILLTTEELAMSVQRELLHTVIIVNILCATLKACLQLW